MHLTATLISHNPTTQASNSSSLLVLRLRLRPGLAAMKHCQYATALPDLLTPQIIFVLAQNARAE